jgi:hypothetical protein
MRKDASLSSESTGREKRAWSRINSEKDERWRRSGDVNIASNNAWSVSSSSGLRRRGEDDAGARGDSYKAEISGYGEADQGTPLYVMPKNFLTVLPSSFKQH